MELVKVRILLLISYLFALSLVFLNVDFYVFRYPLEFLFAGLFTAPVLRLIELMYRHIFNLQFVGLFVINIAGVLLVPLLNCDLMVFVYYWSSMMFLLPVGGIVLMFLYVFYRFSVG